MANESHWPVRWTVSWINLSLSPEPLDWFDQVWGSRRCLNVWFIKLARDVTSVNPHIFQNSLSMSSEATTLSFFFSWLQQLRLRRKRTVLRNDLVRQRAQKGLESQKWNRNTFSLIKNLGTRHQLFAESLFGLHKEADILCRRGPCLC